MKTRQSEKDKIEQARLEGQLEGLDQSIETMELLIADPDLDQATADVVRFYAARLERKRAETLRVADALTFAVEASL